MQLKYKSVTVVVFSPVVSDGDGRDDIDRHYPFWDLLPDK